MWIYLPTQRTFNNRKEAKKGLGITNFNIAFRSKQIIYTNGTNNIANNEVHSNSKQNQ